MSYTFSYEPYAESLYPALLEDAFYIAMEAAAAADTPEPSTAMIRYMDYSMAEAAQYGKLYLSPDTGSGASIWSRPLDEKQSARKSEEKHAFLGRYMGPHSLETYKKIVDFMSDRAGAVVEPDFWYLSIVGLAPPFQNRGRGGALITPVLEKTDALGVATYLETFTPRNMTFYSRLGYEAAASFYEPTAAAEYWIMIRPPGSGL